MENKELVPAKAGMKILILGAKGMLGTDLVEAFSKHEIIGWDKTELDLTDFELVKKQVTKLKPEIIINAAAYTAVDEAEEKRDLAMLINGEVVGNLAKIAKSLDIPIVHYSTDYVFDGEEKEGYKEDEVKIAPLSVYGESKVLGEKLLQGNTDKFYLIRISWLYGKNGKNFVETMLKLGKEKDELSVINDQVGSPTFAKDVARVTKEIIETKKPFGIYHVANSGKASWYDFAKKIFEIAKIDIKVRPIPTEDYPLPAKRPKNSILINTKLKELRGWEEALLEYLND